MSGGATPPLPPPPLLPLPPPPAATSGCTACGKKKKPKQCTKGNDNADDPSDGHVLKNYDPATDGPGPTLDEVNQALDEKLAPWELFNGLFGGFDPGNADFNFGR